MNRINAIVLGSAAAVAALAGTAVAGASNATLYMGATGNYKVNTDVFTVDVNINDLATAAVGAQVRMNYDAAKLDFIGLQAGNQFPLVIYQNSSVSGEVTFATGVYGGQTGFTSGNIAKLQFKPKTLLCSEDAGIGFATSGFNIRISSASGAQIPFSTATSVSVSSLGSFSISGAPAAVSGKACDAGFLGAALAAFTGAAPAANDTCNRPISVSVLVTLPDNSTLNAIPARFPIGTSSVVWSATDAAGNSASESRSVQVDDRQRLVIAAALAGTSAGDSTRAMNMTYSGGPSGGQSANIAMVNTAGSASGSVEVDIAPAVAAAPACASLKDITHSLRKVQAAGFSTLGTKWTVDFGALTQGDSNNDDLVDILDFGMYVGDTNASVASNARSNFDGDTDVDTGDYTFISGNFFQVGAACGSAWHPAPLASVTLKQLRRMGMGDLAVADINRDGRIDQADIVAFMQGQRGGEATRNAGAGNAAE